MSTDGYYIQDGRQFPGWVAQLVRASSRCAKVVGLIPGQRHIQESTTEYISKWNNKFLALSISVSLSHTLPPFLLPLSKIIVIITIIIKNGKQCLEGQFFSAFLLGCAFLWPSFFVYPANVYWITCYVPDTYIGASNTSMNKTNMVPSLKGLVL